ncbi:MAG TPA: hypothetical protein VKX96_16545 [Chloroflexota bacterium]|nr:hypothetical protein [Chloroflexota bacterium]
MAAAGIGYAFRTIILEYDNLSGTVLPLTNVVSFDSVISYWIALTFLTVPTAALIDGIRTASSA